MKLSDFLEHIELPCTLVSDGEFDAPEQCTRVRGKNALVFLTGPRYLNALQNSNVSCVICTPELQEQIPGHIAGILTTGNPKLLFFLINNILADRLPQCPTVIASSARISPQACVAPNNVVIGENAEIQPFAVIKEGTTIGSDVLIGSGTVVGGESFSTVQDGSKTLLVRDGGSVQIETGVKIGCQCSIARGILPKDVTAIGAYSMVGHNVLISHGTTLGRQGYIAGHANISGNCIIGEKVWIGPSAVLANRIVVGDGARITLGAAVVRNVPAGAVVSGNFAIDHQKFLENFRQSLRNAKK